MTYYKARVEADLQDIRDRLSSVSTKVNHSIQKAVEAIVNMDHDALYSVMLGDPEINRETRAIDAKCHAFIARHLPAAKHLRFISSALRLSIALERIGDYSVTVARVGVRLENQPPELMMDDLQNVSDRSCKMLKKAIKAFVNEDAELAKSTAAMSKKVDKKHDKFFEKVINEENPELLQTIRLLTIMSKLERVSDQAKNMCEEALFVNTGETKQKSPARIIFVDESNDFLSQLAVLLSQKAFPNSGKYYSAGWNPAAEVSPKLAAAVDQFGLEANETSITELKPFRQAMAEYSVIVSINGGDTAPLGLIPFHSIHLKWNINENQEIDVIIHELSSKINDLIITLRGVDAS